jgi:uncharacterized repeat protein (TIGR01451 family)
VPEAPPPAPLPGGAKLPEPGSAAMPAPTSLPEPPGSVPPSIPAGVSGAAPVPGAGPKSFAPDEKGTEVSVTPDNPTGRQEAAVSLEWLGGAPVAKVGQSAEYSLLVRNTSNIPVQRVVVGVHIPAGLTVQNTEPKASLDAGNMIWELGTLAAKQERSLQLRLQADTKGDVLAQAWVTFTGASIMRIRVREPKLLVKVACPEKVLVGDPAAFTLTVSNPGDGSADQVKIQAVLSDGLEHARGNKIDFDIGNLAAGESRNVTLLCATRVGGAQKCEAMASAEGSLTAKEAATLNVIMPRLDLHVDGPGLRYLDRKATYTLRVTNPGDAPATNVTVADTVPAGFKVLSASDGGRPDYQTRQVSWFLGEVGPGQTREVKLEVQAISPGEHHHKATAVGARGLRAEAEHTTRVEGLSALMIEMVDTEDPIEVNGDTAYEVRITNTGSKTETDIKLVATIPDRMQFKNAQGPVSYREEGKTVTFMPIEKLAPRADALFRINVKALDPGTVRFKVQVTSTNLTEPVIKMEPTRIYADAPESSGSPAPAVAPAPSPTMPAAPATMPAVPPAGSPPPPPPGAGVQ